VRVSRTTSGNHPHRQHRGAAARELVGRIFRLVDRKWRGIGEIPSSGLAIRELDAQEGR
jgi:hydrogenase maturation factor